MSFSFPTSFEEYAIAVSSRLFAKRGIEPYYLPIEWSGQPLAREIHLAKPSIFLSLHSKFAFGSAAILEQGGEVVTIAAKPHKHDGRFRRGGIAHPGRITLLERDAMSLVNLRREMSGGKHAACFVDAPGAAPGKAYIHEGMFKFGRMSGNPVFFLRFGVNERGRIEGAIEGPVDCGDLTAAMERFLSFTGAAIEISPHPRSYR